MPTGVNQVTKSKTPTDVEQLRTDVDKLMEIARMHGWAIDADVVVPEPDEVAANDEDQK